MVFGSFAAIAVGGTAGWASLALMPGVDAREKPGGGNTSTGSLTSIDPGLRFWDW
jgi:hypothetical protein